MAKKEYSKLAQLKLIFSEQEINQVKQEKAYLSNWSKEHWYQVKSDLQILNMYTENLSDAVNFVTTLDVVRRKALILSFLNSNF
ncbi:MAG: hypothetical protein F6J92_25775 [Symploca sp. SIO1A3]|nr:hypothetical protein [Symploca sp. SIO2C1]NER50029.1 hypothetical protein [Symploca sp. SIO1A3]